MSPSVFNSIQFSSMFYPEFLFWGPGSPHFVGKKPIFAPEESQLYVPAFSSHSSGQNNFSDPVISRISSKSLLLKLFGGSIFPNKKLVSFIFFLMVFLCSLTPTMPTRPTAGPVFHLSSLSEWMIQQDWAFAFFMWFLPLFWEVSASNAESPGVSPFSSSLQEFQPTAVFISPKWRLFSSNFNVQKGQFRSFNWVSYSTGNFTPFSMDFPCGIPMLFNKNRPFCLCNSTQIYLQRSLWEISNGVALPPPFEGKLLRNSAILTAKKPRTPPRFGETLTEVGMGTPVYRTAAH